MTNVNGAAYPASLPADAPLLDTNREIPDGYIRVGYNGGERNECYINLRDDLKRHRKVMLKDQTQWMTWLMNSDPTIGYSGNCCGMGAITKVNISFRTTADLKELVKLFVENVKGYREYGNSIPFNQYYFADAWHVGRTLHTLLMNLPGYVVCTPIANGHRMGTSQPTRAAIWYPPWSKIPSAYEGYKPEVTVIKDGKSIDIPLGL